MAVFWNQAILLSLARIPETQARHRRLTYQNYWKKIDWGLILLMRENQFRVVFEEVCEYDTNFFTIEIFVANMRRQHLQFVTCV